MVGCIIFYLIDNLLFLSSITLAYYSLLFIVVFGEWLLTKEKYFRKDDSFSKSIVSFIHAQNIELPY